MAKVMRVAGEEEGDGKSGKGSKSNGVGDKEGNGREEGNGKGGKSNSNCNEDGG